MLRFPSPLRSNHRGLAPTGKKMKWESVVIWRVVDGDIVEMLAAVSDELDFLKQLSVIEYKRFLTKSRNNSKSMQKSNQSSLNNNV
jgi:hypothetical protein